MNVSQELIIEKYKLDSLCFKDKYAKEYPCHLFGYWTKILLSTTESDNHQLFICHNNGLATYYDINTFQKIDTDKSVCPKFGIISLLSTDRHFYVGDLERVPKILRFNPEYPKDFIYQKKERLATPLDSSWLQQNDYMQFTFIFETNNFVYFLLREVAEEENSYCHVKGVKSRIVRMSKNDPGGTSYTLQNNWITFVKATIICPDKSNNLKDSELNFIESAHFDKDRQILYTTFSSGETETTAICQYSMNDIEIAFDGPFMDISEPKVAVSKSLTSCENKQSCIAYMAAKYQIKFLPVVPSLKKNLVFHKGEIWTHIQVISIERSSRQYDILFVANSKNQIKKFFRKITENYLCYSETLFLLPNTDDQIPIITDMKLINSKSFPQPFLIVTVPNGVYKIGIEHCSIHSIEISCVDPFCFWDTNSRKCKSIFEITVFQLRQLPELEYCSDGREIFDTKWEQWSSWKSCGGNENICQCRMRNCKFGYCTNSDNQDNSEIEVKNCSIHKQWSTWSVWSGCDSQCGIGNSTRYRVCFQGKNCLGEAMETKPCKIENQCRTKIPIAEWSSWSECFPKCGPGVMKRKKLCQERYLNNDFQMDFCSLIEIKNCSVNECTNIIQMSPVAKLTEELGETYYLTNCQGTKSEDNDKIVVSVEYDTKNYALLSDNVWSCWSNWTDCPSHCTDTSDEIVKTSRKRLCKITNDLIKNDLCREISMEDENCNDDLCYKGLELKEEKGFQLIYVILVGVVSFAISCLIVVAAVCIYFSKKKVITKYVQNPSQMHSLPRSLFQRGSYSPSQRSPVHSPNDYGWTSTENYHSISRQPMKNSQLINIPPPSISQKEL